MKLRASINDLLAMMAVATVVLGVSLSVPASGEDNSNEFAQAVDETWREYSALVNAGDADTWIRLWDDDGVQMPPGAPANVGKTAILQGIRGAFEAYDYRDFVINNREVEVFGDFGFASGTYSTLLFPKAEGEPIFIDGKYLTIFKKQADGTWKIYRDAFNSNVAPKQ